MNILAGNKGGRLIAVGFLVVAAGGLFLWWDEPDRAGIAATDNASALPASPQVRSSAPEDAGRNPAQVAAAASLKLSLEIVGEIALPDGDVQRVYRVHVANDDEWRSGMEVELVRAGPGITVIEGRAALGNLAPAARVSSADTITLRHDPGLQIDATLLQWHWGAVAGSETSGTLLSGAADERAINVLRDYDSTQIDEPAGAAAPSTAQGFAKQGAATAHLSAVIERNATVDQVNTVLIDMHALIVQMRPGSPTVELRLTHSAGNDSLANAADRLQASGSFEWARPIDSGLGDFAQLQGDAIPPPDPEPEFDDHRPR